MSESNKMEKLFYIGPTVFCLPDDFKGGYTEAITEFLKYHLNVVEGWIPSSPSMDADNLELFKKLTKTAIDEVFGKGQMVYGYVALQHLKNGEWEDVPTIE